jgi:hypothetical protein
MTEVKTNRREDPEIKPCSYSQLILTKEPKTYTGEGSLFNKCCRENWLSVCRRLKPLSLTLYKKINSNRMEDLNVRSETLKLPLEKIGKTVEDKGLGVIIS